MFSLRYAPVLALLSCCSVYDESLLRDAPSGEAAGAQSSAGTAHLNLAGRASGGSNGSGSKGAGAGAADVAEAGASPNGTGGAASLGNAGSSAAGGAPAAGAAGQGSAGVAGGAVVLPAGVDLVDDMEDGNNYLAASPPRYGFWYVAGDMTAGGKLPLIGELIATLAPARGTSALGVHFKATGFKDWGSSVGLSFTNAANKRGIYDAGDALGISFWVRGSVTDSAKLRVLFPTLGSDPTGTQCGGKGQGQCLDHYATQVSVTADWQEVQVAFGSLHQAGWGAPLSGFQSQEMLGIEWTAGPLDVDIWLDDLALIRPE